MTAPADRLCRWVVEQACLALSVFNTQPWTWHISPPDRIDLYADRTRQLSEADPHGRELVISCGAALHHAQLAAEAAGLTVRAIRMPDLDDGDWLTSLRLGAGRITAAAEAALAALRRRRMDRRRFTAWPIPDDRLVRLASDASDAQVELVPLVDRMQRARVEALLAEAMRQQRTNPRLAEEQRADHRGASPSAQQAAGWQEEGD